MILFVNICTICQCIKKTNSTIIYLVVHLKNIDYTAVGRKIREQRKKLKITQEQLAEMCEVSPSYIGHIERGSRNLSMNMAVQLCSVLGIGLDYLFLDSAENSNEITNCITSALSACSDEQKKRFFKTIKILADNINKI